jgi:Mg2+/Co2+ transporter CorC
MAMRKLEPISFEDDDVTVIFTALSLMLFGQKPKRRAKSLAACERAARANDLISTHTRRRAAACMMMAIHRFREIEASQGSGG